MGVPVPGANGRLGAVWKRLSRSLRPLVPTKGGRQSWDEMHLLHLKR